MAVMGIECWNRGSKQMFERVLTVYGNKEGINTHTNSRQLPFGVVEKGSVESGKGGW